MNGEDDVGYQVELFVYDLSKGLARSMSPALLGKQIEGIWHTGVVAYGREYFFGSGGIESCRPGGTILGQPDRVEELGESQVPYQLFLEYIFGLGEAAYKPGAYDLFKHNCNNFSDEVSQFLCGRGIPKTILQLPDQVLNTSLGETVSSLVKNLDIKSSGSRKVNFANYSSSNNNNNNNNSVYDLTPTQRHNDSPDLELERLNEAIDQVRQNTQRLEDRRNSINKKVDKREKKKKKEKEKKERKEKKKKKRKSQTSGEEGGGEEEGGGGGGGSSGGGVGGGEEDQSLNPVPSCSQTLPESLSLGAEAGGESDCGSGRERESKSESQEPLAPPPTPPSPPEVSITPPQEEEFVLSNERRHKEMADREVSQRGGEQQEEEEVEDSAAVEEVEEEDAQRRVEDSSSPQPPPYTEAEVEREPPITFKDKLNALEEYNQLAACCASLLTPEEHAHLEELRAYVIDDEGSWALGENFSSLLARVLHDGGLPDEARVHLVRLMAAAALKDDVILLLHQDRRDHTIMNYANKVESLSPHHQEALALFFCNMFEHVSPSEWLLYISEWQDGAAGQTTSNIRVTTKVAVNALLNANTTCQELGSAIMYNLGTKEVKTVVFDDVAPELAMAILQYFNSHPPEELLWRTMAALCRFTYSSSEVPALIKMIGPEPSTFKGVSERVDALIEEIDAKLSRVRLF